jgi:hypothetical protein
MKAIVLLNPHSFYITAALIGYQNKKNTCLLLVFRGKNIIFKRDYFGLKNAMRGFSNVFKNDEGIKPQWSDYVYCFNFKAKIKNRGTRLQS